MPALSLIIIQAAALQQTIQITLNLHVATICYTATPRKVKEISLYFHLLYCTYGRHMQDTCEGHSHSTPHMGTASRLH